MCFFLFGFLRTILRFIQRLHRREQQYVTDSLAICKKHNETVDTVADTTCGRHTDLQCIQEIFVGVVGFLITGISGCILQFETLSLIDRIVQLRVSIAHFPCIDKELEALYLLRIGRFLLGQRGDSDRVIHNECRLDQVLLAELLEEQVYNIALCMTLLVFDVMLVCQLLGFLITLHFVKINTGIFLDAVYHGNALEGLTKVDLDTIVAEFGAADNLLCQIAEHTLGQLHHTLIIGICLIKLHQRELRIVTGIHTLVTEYTADLVYTLHTADDQSLQVQLQRDTKLNILIQRIVMCLERSCRSTAGIGYQHRCLHLDKVASVKEIADLLDDLGALDKGLFNLRIHDQIHVTLTIAGICICQTVEFLRKGLQTLGQQSDLLYMNRSLSCLCLEYLTFNTDDITDIIFLKICIRFLTYSISGHVALDAARKILNITEGRFTHDAFEHHTSGQTNCFAFEFLILVNNVCSVIGHIVFCDLKGILPSALQISQLITAHL